MLDKSLHSPAWGSSELPEADLLLSTGKDQGQKQGTDLCTGTVRAFLSPVISGIETPDGARVHASQAASCLLAPAIGDRVLVCRDGDEVFVLAVLARHQAFAAEISVPNADTVSIRAAREITFDAPLLKMTARSLALLCDHVLELGTVLTRNFRRIVESVGEKSVKAQSISTHAENRTAVVSGTDMLRAKLLVETIEGVATQTSEIALVTARRDVRLDGERVTLG